MTQSRHDSELATFLYDETGCGVHDEIRLAALLEDADNNVWLVPVIALQQSVENTTTEHPRHKHPNREHLGCRECGQDTAHRFSESEAVPDIKWVGQPLWECQDAERFDMGRNPKQISRRGVELTNKRESRSELLVNRKPVHDHPVLPC